MCRTQENLGICLIVVPKKMEILVFICKWSRIQGIQGFALRLPKSPMVCINFLIQVEGPIWIRVFEDFQGILCEWLVEPSDWYSSSWNGIKLESAINHSHGSLFHRWPECETKMQTFRIIWSSRYQIICYSLHYSALLFLQTGKRFRGNSCPLYLLMSKSHK